MDGLQTAVCELITKFVARQKIPYEVIKHYRAFLVDPSQRRSIDKDYIRATGMGHWGENNEWEYRLHGAGCHVSHLETGEIIGWDANGLNRFDPYWFGDWVNWYVAFHPTDSLTEVVKPLIGEDYSATTKNLFPILEQLHRLGKLNYYPNSTSKYELCTDAS